MNKNMNDIPVPVMFNCWKHHLSFLKEQIKIADEISFNNLISGIRIIGEGLMDLYLGEIDAYNICELILSRLNPGISKSYYEKWLFQEGKDFRVLKISDESEWVLRLGEDNARYIHIHPARYSPFTLRVKAGTLKTGVCTAAWSKIYKTNTDINLINTIRKTYLNLSPVKNIDSVPALMKLIKLLTSGNPEES